MLLKNKDKEFSIMHRNNPLGNAPGGREPKAHLQESGMAFS